MAPFFRYPPDRVSKTEAGAIRNHPDTSLPQPPRCGSKREAEGIRKRPQLPNLHMRLSGRKPLNQHPNNPRNRREKAFQTKFEMPPPQPFLLHHQKAHLLFLGKEDGGFEAAGLLRHSRPDGKRFCPAAEPQSHRPSLHFPAPRRGAPPHPRKGGNLQLSFWNSSAKISTQVSSPSALVEREMW